MRGALVGSVTVLWALGACAADAGSGASTPGMMTPEQEFDTSAADLQMEFGGGDGKADLFGVDPCAVLEPIVSHGEGALRSGFYMGVEGQTVLGSAAGFGGFDIVFDIYHHQMSVSRYLGAGVALPGIGASIQFYAGVALGFQHGVSDWDGYFVTAEVDVGLPFMREFLSLSPMTFVSGVDANEDGLISPTEVLVPPNGVYGFGVGLSVGVEVPTGLPIAGTVTEGLWQPYDTAIRHYYDELRNTRFLRVGSHLDVHLVDHETGRECHEDWPYSGTDEACVIEFGDPSWSHTRRGLHTGYGICTVTGRCAVPIAWPMSAAAIGVGALRDAGGAVRTLCPGLDLGGEGGH